ncbi:MAG: peptidylprolyl isomerase [Halobacteriota archaeon]|nr:peptidylprolyl isomerase [Halobacteriota archaeon]
MSGCVEEEAEIRAQSGDTVKVHYTGTLDDGTVFDSSIGRDPLQFTVDSGQMIVGFNRAVNGMKLGEKKTVKIPADQAYGQYREDLVQVVNRSELPEEMEPEVGQQLMSQQADGRIIVFTVISISELNVTLDANHRLAGEDLTFEIELVEIV